MFQVMKEKCAECLYSKNKIVSDERRAEILKGCARDDTHFICHKASIEGKSVCCKGFYDSSTTNLIRVAGRLGMIQETNEKGVVDEK